MKDLIQRLHDYVEDDRYNYMQPSTLLTEAAGTLERLTAGDVALPEPDWASNSIVRSGAKYYLEKTLIDYGNRRAAAAVLTARDQVPKEQP